MQCPGPGDKTAVLWPEAQCGVWKRWTYSFASPLLSRTVNPSPEGPQRRLDEEGLYRVSPEECIQTLQGRLAPHLAQGEAPPSLSQFRTGLWAVARPTFLPAGGCQLVVVACQVSLPFILKAFVEHIQSSDRSDFPTFNPTGLLYAVLMGLAAFGNSLFANMQEHLATRTGIRLRAALIHRLYTSTLHLSPEGRRGLHPGELTNLVANDAQKLFDVMREAHLFWSAPLQILLVSILLLVILGPSCIAGIAIFMSLVPLVKLVITKMAAVRSARMPVADERVKLCSEVLTGIKITKLNFWEEAFLSRISELRKQEVKYLRKELFVWGFTLLLTVLAPVLATAATFSLYVTTGTDNILTAADVFGVLCLFSALRFPINDAGKLLGNASAAYKALLRIHEFLLRDAQIGGAIGWGDPSESSSKVLLQVSEANFAVGGSTGTASKDEVAVEVKCQTTSDGSVKVSPSDQGSPPVGSSTQAQAFVLKDINVTIKAGRFYAVVGGVGAGKTTLLHALMGLVAPQPGTKSCSRSGTVSMAYAAQAPFILNATIRDNILFGALLDEALYAHVLEACCLGPDLKMLTAGDATEIGERGLNLSGGQKARISVARALYARADLLFLDDPLSALDASTGRDVFDRLRRSPLLERSGVVLVTHAVHFLSQFDEILLLHDGKVCFQGGWEALAAFPVPGPDDDSRGEGRQELAQVLATIQGTLQEGSSPQTGPTPGPGFAPGPEEAAGVDPKPTAALGTSGRLVVQETREDGASKWSTWTQWFGLAGGVPFVFFQILFMAWDRSAYVGTEWWLAQWCQAAEHPVKLFGHTLPQQTDLHSQWIWLRMYLAIVAMSIVAVFVRTNWAVAGGSRAAERLFNNMVHTTLKAKMSFFETIPLGRLLNRFTYDVENLDIKLTQTMAMLMISLSWFVAGVTVMCSILPWIVVVLIPVFILYYRLQRYFRPTSVDLQRLDAKSRSPIQSLLAEMLDGLDTITVFNQQERFREKFENAVDRNLEAVLAFTTAQRWMGLRVDFCGGVVTLVACILVATVVPVGAGMAGLLLVWTSNFTITLQFMIRASNETEAAITSVERCLEMCNLESEEPADKVGQPAILPESWPASGKLEFDHVYCRYRDGLPWSLKDMSFVIEPGQRVGVVGRTGAGKSTVTAVLFRLIEAAQGRILLDGLDLGLLGLWDVRGRPHSMCIIPQDPVLFSGTIRDCIDPFRGHSDDAVKDVLAQVRMVATLSTHVESAGKNFSMGERQLLCLARALLARPKLLVMDEATASVDGETDAFIQKMIRESDQFANTSILCIAHRLHTIMDYDKIMVVADGGVAEFDSAQRLLELRDGAFRKLVEATGDESAAALFNMALKTK